MAYDPAKARVYNEARAQGLTEDQAFAAAGITEDEALTDYVIDEVGSPDPNRASYNPNYGQLTQQGFSRPQSTGAADTSDPQLFQAQTFPVSAPQVTPIPPATDPQLPRGTGFAPPQLVDVRNESSTQDTVTGGGGTTTVVEPALFRDTPASIRYQAEADRVGAEKAALTAQLKAQGKNFREINRDERYRELSREQNSYEVAAFNTKEAVPGTGDVTVQSNGSGSDTVQYQPSSPAFVTTNAGIEDPFVQQQEISETPAAIDGDIYSSTTGISPYGEENDAFAGPPEIQPGQDDFENELEQARLAQAREDQEFLEQGTGISPYGEQDDVFEGPPVQQEDGVSPYAGQDTPFGFTPNPSGTITAQQTVAAQQQATLAQARAQAALQAQRKQANDGDWRVRLRLAPGATYLYKADQPGILQPLAVTDGVVFPYTPQISTVYKANYNQYDLTHSNYRGYFYQGSQVEDINITATFTAQDSAEANYLLAVIHFFRSATKMFYGQDAQRGAPPPLVFLQGLGEYQFNLAPCVIASFNYNLPQDVDYIRAGSPNINGTNLLQRRSRQDLPTNPFSAAWSRIQNVLGAQGVRPGAVPGATPPGPPTLGTNRPTYVPTKMEISITLHPIQSRSQVSKQFSVKGYASGDLLKGGFW